MSLKPLGHDSCHTMMTYAFSVRSVLIGLCIGALGLVVSCSGEPDAGNVDADTASANNDAGSSDADAGSANNDTGSGDADAGSKDADTGGATALIHKAGLCDIPAHPRTSVNAGDDLVKLTLEAPNALCNDGSPAIIYVRPATEQSPNADRWVVWLEGGGGCNDAASCVERWCGDHHLYTAAKMSSRFAPDGIEGKGIFSKSTANHFAGYNLVAAYYCSSDNWSGRQRTTASDPSVGTTYDLYFHGAYIIDAMVETLKRGGASDDGSVSMPSIDNASLVLFAGTSAGGGGVRFNADRVGEMLRQTNPDLDFRLAVDAGTYPSEPHPPELSEDDALAILDHKQDVLTNWRNAINDESCLEYHSDDPRRCADNTHLLVHHITTPWFVKMDLTDSANAPGPYEDVPTFARIAYEFYSALDADELQPEEADVDLSRAGLFVPNCGHHVNFDVPAFANIRLTNGNDQLSTHDVLSNWIERDGPTRAVHDPANGLTSVCP